ncbi:MAG TPA: response regulator [Spirochaetes bacterium]|nr:response regulator [Spirochaetota bacterium]
MITNINAVSVDDEKINLLLIDSMGKQLGMNINSFLDPKAAVEFIETNEVDLIFVDYMMPGIDGVEFIKKARVIHPDIPIIMITAVMTDDELKLRAFEAGATEFLNKPLNSAEFVARVTNLADLRKSQLLLKDRAMLLEDEVLKATEKIVQREHETLNVLGKAAEYKDPETAAHIARVAYYSKLLAEALGKDKKKQQLILYAAPLHDIGKIGIPDSILLKPGKLTAEEFEIVKTHPAIGVEIIGDAMSGYLTAGAVVAKYHHERFNGKGYPAGLSGDEIHIFGRIVAVADVFDALTSKRPYKGPWTFEKSLDLLVAEKGKHFDPQIVDHFVSLRDEVVRIFNTYSDDI